MAAAAEPKGWWPPRVPHVPRWARVLIGVASVWGSLRYIDYRRTKTALEPIMAEAHKVLRSPSYVTLC